MCDRIRDIIFPDAHGKINTRNEEFFVLCNLCQITQVERDYSLWHSVQMLQCWQCYRLSIYYSIMTCLSDHVIKCCSQRGQLLCFTWSIGLVKRPRHQMLLTTWPNLWLVCYRATTSSNVAHNVANLCVSRDQLVCLLYAHVRHMTDCLRAFTFGIIAATYGI